MAIPFSIVDAGETAAVVLLRSAETDAWMQELAAFLGFPVAAFVRASAGGFTVRLFAPAAELDVSGTGLAAAAHALWHAELVAPTQPVTALTRNGVLVATRQGARVEVAQDGQALFTTGLPRTVARGELTWPP